MAVNVGSIVLWNSIAGTFGANSFSNLEQHPALVTRIWQAAAPQTVNLHILPDQGTPFTVANVPEDDTASTPNSWTAPVGVF